MPVYSIRAPDGNVYRIRGPEGATSADVAREVMRQYPDAGTPTPRRTPRPIQRENALERIPIVGRGLAALADIPLQSNAGVASFGTTISDLFGPNRVSTALNDAGDYLRSLRSSGARHDEQMGNEDMERAEGTGFFNEVGAGLHAFGRAPIDYTASGLGSMAPMALAAYFGGPAAAIGLGTASGAGNIKGVIYSRVRDELIAQGMPRAEAEARADEAQSYTGENWYHILGGGVLGGIGGRLGLTRSAANIAVNRALGRITAEEAEQLAARAAADTAAKTAAARLVPVSAARATARSVAEEFGSEALEGAQERLASNAAARGEGIDTGLMDGVVSQGVLEGTIGALLGGIGGMAEARSHNANVPQARVEALIQAVEQDVPAAADGDEQARARLTQKLKDMGYDEERAANRANTYIDLELQDRAARNAAPAAAPEPDEVSVGRAPTAPDIQPVAPEVSEAPVEPTPDPAARAAQITRLLDDTDYINRMAERQGVSDSEIVADLQDELSSVEAQLPPVQSTYAPRTAPEAGVQAAERVLIGDTELRDADIAALPEAEQQAYQATLMDAEFGPTGGSIPAQPEAVANPTEDPEEFLPAEAVALGDNPELNLPEPEAAPVEEDTQEFLPGEMFSEQLEAAPQEQVDEAAVIDEMIAEQQALLDAQPVKSTPVAKKAQRAIQQLQDAKDGLNFELPFNNPVVPTEEEVERAQTAVAASRARSEAQRVESERQTVAETQAMVNNLGPNYAGYEFTYNPEAPQKPFEIYVNNRAGRRLRRSTHGTLKSFLKAVDELKGVVQEAEEAENTVKTSATIEKDGYKNSRTAGHKAVQELVAEIDQQSVEGKKRLSNIQRTELLRMLENPVKYTEEGKVKPELDAEGNPIPYTVEQRRAAKKFKIVEQRTEAVRKVQAALDANGTDKKSDARTKQLREELRRRNEELLTAVSEITEPVRARMQEMVEGREDELFGSKQIVEDLAVQEKLGESDLQEMREMVTSLRSGYDTYIAKQEQSGLDKETFNTTPAGRRLKAKHDQYIEARAFLDRAMQDLAEVRADRRKAKQDYDEARVFRSVVLPRLEQEAKFAFVPEAPAPIAYGVDEINALLKDAVSSGKITKEGAELAQWVLDKNPAIASDLLLSLSEDSSLSGGMYTVGLNAIEAAAGDVRTDPLLLTHEILHHTERMLPTKLQNGIEKLWKADLDFVSEEAEGDEKAYFDAITKLHNTKDSTVAVAAYHRAMGYLMDGSVHYSMYRYLNPSEYWVANGSELLAARYSAKTTMGKIQQWYREFVEKLKDIFGKASAAPIIRALDSILSSDGSFIGDTIFTAKGLDRELAAPRIPSKLSKTIKESGTKTSEGLRRAQQSSTVDQMAENSLGTIKEHLSSDETISWLGKVWNNIDARTLDKYLKVLPTSGIIGWKGKDLPGIQTAIDKVNEMVALKSNILKAQEKTAQELNKFQSKYGDETLSKTMTAARINEVSMGDFANVKEALQKDPVLVEIRKLQAKSTADAEKTARLNKAEAARIKQVEDSYGLWEQLGKQQGGQELYLKLREFYQTSYIAMRAAHDKIIESFPDKTAARNLLSQVRREMEEAAVRDESDVYADLPPDVFPKDYFPFMRFGKYYLQVAAVNGMSKQFYTFDSPAARDTAMRNLAKSMKINLKSPKGKRVFNTGDDIANLQENFRTGDEMMRKVFELLDKTKSQLAVGRADLEGLTNSVYQIYLMSSPERSLRRAFLKSENVVGMSMDVLRTFSTRAASVANQLARVEYGNDARLAMQGVIDNIDPLKERDIDERRRLMTIASEMQSRVEAELDPQDPSWIVNTINRLSYIYFLTAPATALVQFTSIPIRVMPHLGAKYGYAKSTAIWGKYVKLWNSVGFPKGGKTPTVADSALVKNNPLLSKALDVGMRRGVLETLGQTLVNNEAAEAGSSRGKTRQYAAKLHDLMTYLFTASENVSKQAAYLMAFELHHDKLMSSEKPTTEEARKDIFDRSVTEALTSVSETIGDYSSIERPSVMKGDIGRAVFLFKAFSMAQTKWFIGSARQALGGGDFTTEERNIARKDILGVTMMSFMFSGLAGLPLYSLGAMVLKGIADMFDDDEEKREHRLRSPYTADNYDLWFRYEVLPSIFGEATFLGRPLSAIMANGPVSELTGVNVASRTSMDLKQMWLRDSPSGDTPLGTAGNFVLSNIAGFGMAQNFSKAYEAFQDGDIQRGIELLLPAAFRGPLTATRLGGEGLLTKNDKVIMSPEEFTEANLIMQMLGFQPMKASSLQQMRVAIESFDASVRDERSDLMDTYADAVRAGAPADEIEAAMQDIIEYNDRRPDPQMAISLQDLEKSIKARNRQIDVRGVGVNKNEVERTQRAFDMVK